MGSPSSNPYPELARRRQTAAVLEEEVEVRPDGSRRPWFGVYRWEAVRAALGDDALSSRVYGETMGLDGRYGEVLIGMDPPEHRHHRGVLQPPFSRTAVTGRLRTTTTGTIEPLIDDLAARGSADLVTEVCEPLPAIVLTRLLDLPGSDAGPLAAQALVVTADDPGPARAASDALLERLLPVIDERRRNRTADDLISILARSTIGDRPLTDLEVFSHLRLLAIAGTDTVSRATANLLFGLLAHPAQLHAVRQDGRLAAAAAEEAMRWECPALSVPRVAVRATRIEDVEVPPGAAVRCGLGAANRDPGRWPDPDRFDIFREAKPNAGFGLGAHACLGVHLAHQVMEHTVTTLLDRLPAVHLDPDAPPPEIVGRDLRAPTHLRVRWG